MTATKLCKIESARFGLGGYQDAQFGFAVSFKGPGWGVSDFWGEWGIGVECGEHSKWTEADRDAAFAKTCRRVNQLLIDAKAHDVQGRSGKPAEVTFDGMTLKSGRILTEVL